ncbi:Zn-finger-containing protein [Anopheles sinensis]|uniref:Zn-finger-containing protein n=1 Tax=Anopheles sinensis TaxID=74873 RepID=A0A084VUK7_ANOSI|nr:Zn-finger-containing protein [Anopheles sinensis]
MAEFGELSRAGRDLFSQKQLLRNVKSSRLGSPLRRRPLRDEPVPALAGSIPPSAEEGFE